MQSGSVGEPGLLIGGRDVGRGTQDLGAWKPGFRRRRDGVARSLARWPGRCLGRLGEGDLPGVAASGGGAPLGLVGEISLQATELAHEAYFKLLRQDREGWKNRAQLFAVLSRLIRRLLVDHARHRERRKRGGDVHKVTLDATILAGTEPSVDVIVLEQALGDLTRIDLLAAQVVEVLFFGGLTHDEASEALGVGRATVGRKWRFARAWLATRLAA